MLGIISDKYDGALAFAFGLLAGAGAAALGEYGVHPTLQALASKVGISLPLEDVIKYSLGATVGTPIISKALAPKKFDEWVKENPVDSKGITGVMVGASLYATLKLYMLNP